LEKQPGSNITLGTPKCNQNAVRISIRDIWPTHIFVRKTIKQKELTLKVMIFYERCALEPTKHLFKSSITKIRH
jgi:hypothetical protein